MDLQPYGPIEKAIQKSIVLQPLHKKPPVFFWGVLATLVAGVIVFGIVVKKE